MAILTGLGIVGFAICIAATPMISDAIAAFVIFVEKRFTIDDVVKVGNDEPAVIVGLTWRSTQLKNAEGMVFSLPNRKLTEQNIQNLTIDGRTIDFISATVTTKHDPEKIMQVLRQAMDGVANLLQDAERGTSVQEIEVNGDKKTIKYKLWWYLRDYYLRNQTRNEIFARVSLRLAEPDMEGTEVKFA